MSKYDTAKIMEQTLQQLENRILKTETVNWRKLQFIQSGSFKKWSDASKQKLKSSLLKNKFAQPFYVWHDESKGVIYCLDGKHRTDVLHELASSGVPVPEKLPATFVACTDKEDAAKMVLVYSSIYARITEEGLTEFFDTYNLNIDEMSQVMDLPDFDMLSFESSFKEPGDSKEIVAQSLAEKFIVPPFSIFDSRQGYWQDRKKLWHKLGFNSQATREDVELVAKSGQAPAIYELRNKMRKSLGREPEWDEIIAEAEKRGMHIYSGASVFDPVLTEICYRWFCPAGGSILDPFAGGSVRGIVAGILGLDYLGIDLREEQVKENELQLKLLKSNSSIISNDTYIDWYAGDSNEVLSRKIFDQQLFDFIFSCPPYHDLEQYSDDPADLSNMTYEQFLAVYGSIIQKCMRRLKNNRFACFVVGEIRDEFGNYRGFVPDTIRAFTKCLESDGEQVMVYNEIILINVAGSLPVRIGRQFGGYRKVGKMHQNVLVFYKGDPKKIKEEFPEINAAEYLQELNYQPNIGLSIVDD